MFQEVFCGDVVIDVVEILVHKFLLDSEAACDLAPVFCVSKLMFRASIEYLFRNRYTLTDRFVKDTRMSF